MDIPAGTWTIDPAHTSVGFEVRHLMVSKVRGQFKKFSGVANTGAGLSGSGLKAEVETASISTGDKGRDAHLKSADFFDVERFPKMTYEVNRLELTDDPLKVKLLGELTIRDVTKPVTFDVEIGGVMRDPYGKLKGAAEATATIKRSEFGLNWNQALEAGGVLVSDEVKIIVEAQATLDE